MVSTDLITQNKSRVSFFLTYFWGYQGYKERMNFQTRELAWVSRNEGMEVGTGWMQVWGDYGWYSWFGRVETNWSHWILNDFSGVVEPYNSSLYIKIGLKMVL